jgi:hypothetical protein
MRSHWLIRAARAATALGLLGITVGVAVAAARPVPERPRARRTLNLFAVTNAVMDVNRVYCGINNLGELCVDPTNSPVLGGGFWPKGTPDQYIFNSGLQLAGVIDNAAGFSWAGDTVGAFFFDARGTQVQGDAVTLVYNSLDPQDAAAWPNGAVIRDTALFASVLIDRPTASQQDLWTRAWDGNPALIAGRTHPMGILVEERGLAWNYPTGNEDIVYFLFTFYNVSASDPAAYANPTIPAPVQAEIAAVGAEFQQRNEAVFNVNIPDGGYTINSLFAAFSMDPDVGDASHNYASAILPFQMALAYKADFLEANFEYPPNIFGAPFTNAPGFIGVKYLQAPSPQGLTMFSNTRNAATAFPDPVGVRQLYRYLSGTVGPSDNPCTVSNPVVRRLCFLDQTDVDTRFYMASGPFSLPPGEARTIVVAYVHAAPLAIVNPFIGVAPASQLKPLIPFPGDSIFANPARIRTLERAAGWVSQSDLNSNSSIEQNEVTTVPRSLLNKALVAQSVFDNKFLLPFSPEAPRFFTIPGDNQVTVVWQPSATETVGDPYFAVASADSVPDPNNPTVNVANPLFDPNYRELDVEGYRIYRGRTSGQLELVAQFDYAGTEIIDFTGGFTYGNCAPDLNPDPASAANVDCPVDFSAGDSAAHPLVGRVIQVPPGGRVLLADSSVLTIQADTLVTGGGTGFPELSDNGVGFAYVDRSVRNSFTYYYAVTAFDVNSVRSGFTSLESAPAPRSVIPRASSGQEAAGQAQLELLAANGNVLAMGAHPGINATTGIFAGPIPPTNGFELGLAAFLPELLGSGNMTVTIDSVVPGSALTNPRDALYYLTAQGVGTPTQHVLPIAQDAFSDTHTASFTFDAAALDPAKAGRFGGDATYTLSAQGTITVPGTWRINGWGRGSINADPANSDFNGPRWWAGSANENTPDPNINHCPGSPGACIQTPLTKTAGALPGVTTIFHPLSYNTVPSVPGRDFEAITSTVARAADMRVYWGAGGVVDSVIDVTHGVPVPFSDKIRASWGILRQASFAGTNAATTADQNNARLTWTDMYCVDPVPTYINRCGGAAQTEAVLLNSAALDPIAATSSNYDGTGGSQTLAQTGTGFIFYIAGHYFVMQMPALPAAGDVWNLRNYSGVVTGTTGTYAFTESPRPPAVPGLRVRSSYTGSTLNAAVTPDSMLDKIHTVPDPYYVTNSLEITPNTKILNFVNLPSQSIIRIYSVSGVLVQVLYHNDATGGGTQTWNLRNRNNQFVASGVYFYHVETPDGKKKVGRFTVINFAQ